MLYPIPLLSDAILYWEDEQAPRVAVPESSQRQATPQPELERGRRTGRTSG
jgi:hypothetical protein